MRGKLEMQLANFWAASIFIGFFLGCSGPKASNRIVMPKGVSPMLSIETLVRALADKNATIEKVADAIGTLGSRQGGEYKVRATDQTLGDVRIGFWHSDSPSAPPSDVTVYPSSALAQKLADLVPFCTTWRNIPNNPGSSPFLYACNVSSQSGVPVQVVALLSSDRTDANAKVTSLVLQRQSIE